MIAELPLLAPRIDPVVCALLQQHDVLLNVLRLDLIHPQIQGNKWFKLKPNLNAALTERHTTILSFGGAYSNHLYALAAAGRHFGLRTIGIVRGELVLPLNPVLAFCQQQGMELVGISRSDYRRKAEPLFLANLQQRFGAFYAVPEGGSNALAVTGCADLAQMLRWQSSARPRLVALACGTGTTLAGIVTGLSAIAPLPAVSVLGVAVLKAPGYLAQQVQALLTAGGEAAIQPHWSILDHYHAGGYARTSAGLTAFLQEFARISEIPVEPVYTGKLMYGLFDLIRRGEIAPGTEVLALHTGGVIA